MCSPPHSPASTADSARCASGQKARGFKPMVSRPSPFALPLSPSSSPLGANLLTPSPRASPVEDLLLHSEDVASSPHRRHPGAYPLGRTKLLSNFEQASTPAEKSPPNCTGPRRGSVEDLHAEELPSSSATPRRQTGKPNGWLEHNADGKGLNSPTKLPSANRRASVNPSPSSSPHVLRSGSPQLPPQKVLPTLCPPTLLYIFHSTVSLIIVLTHFLSRVVHNSFSTHTILRPCVYISAGIDTHPYPLAPPPPYQPKGRSQLSPFRPYRWRLKEYCIRLLGK
jgi:hypothetical protein